MCQEDHGAPRLNGCSDGSLDHGYHPTLTGYVGYKDGTERGCAVARQTEGVVFGLQHKELIGHGRFWAVRDETLARDTLQNLHFSVSTCNQSHSTHRKLSSDSTTLANAQFIVR